jgi:hypothetical protein
MKPSYLLVLWFTQTIMVSKKQTMKSFDYYAFTQFFHKNVHAVFLYILLNHIITQLHQWYCSDSVFHPLIYVCSYLGERE